MIMHLCQSVAASAQDRLWHKADIPTALSNVCFWGTADMSRTLRQVR